MKIVVIGGTGLIGSKVVETLTDHGHEAIAASPNSGVDTLTGEGLADVLVGADVVVDVSNSPSFEDAAVLDFFIRATTNILAAEASASVQHHVALSVVGTDRLPASGYMRAKVSQENLIRASSIPYTLVHATQFFEFFSAIAQGATTGDEVRLSPALVQPIAAQDVSAVVARVAIEPPRNGMLEIGGPEAFGLNEFVERGLKARGDSRSVVPDEQAPYFGALLHGSELVPGEGAELSSTTFAAWLES
ncbi:SDR family oxidoreductase [Rhodococcus sp. IEGM 1381]|uniref:SDR family oxidoreductase n=1 Tax=Rhodococcus sp. IEGM 1381 TaxID=3047085 RepID=UPI0024B73F3A|nr:SDR family oxidoreductase [Rhodococcus sp. IEGM 1381]MDI9893272.1 SDR family oxidoreductase [Rhodococcus sp. IEGM 1381]